MSKKMLKALMIVLICVFSTPSLVFCAEKGTVKIGLIEPLSGPLAKLGKECLEGAEVAKDMVNDRGGLWGKKVQYIVGDGSSPATAASEADRLITQHNIKLLMGTYGSSLAIAASAVVIRYGLTYFEIDSASPKITGRGYPYIYRNHIGSPHLAKAPILFINHYLSKALNIPLSKLRVVCMLEDSAWGTSEAPYFKQYAKEFHVNLVGLQMYNSKSADLSSVVLRIKEMKPDVLIALSYLNDAILFQRQAQQLGLYTKAMIGITAGYDMPELAKALGGAVNGIFSATGSSYLNPKGLLPETRIISKEYHERFEKKTGHMPVSHSSWAFNGAWMVLHDILPKAGSFDPKAIRKVVMHLNEPIGTTIMGYGYKFPKDGWGERVFCVVTQWQHGKQVVVWPKRFAVADPILVPLPPWDQRK